LKDWESNIRSAFRNLGAAICSDFRDWRLTQTP